MNHILITGTSSGIGESLASEFISPYNVLYTVSRRPNQALADKAEALGCRLHYFQGDLTNSQDCEQFIAAAFQGISRENTDKLLLINNAGTLQPIGPLHTLTAEAMKAHYALNVLAPAILMGAFLANTLDWEAPRVVLNISSGAAFIPFSGWSLYGSGKAAVDMMSRVAAIEQKERGQNVKIVALAPGIVDTAMQEEIRNTPDEKFPDARQYVLYKETGKLIAPAALAEIIAASIFNPDIPTGLVIVLDELKKFRLTH